MSKLKKLIAIVFLLQLNIAYRAEAETTGHRTAPTELSSEALARLQAALELSNAGEPNAALDALGKFATDIKTPWEVRSFVGELHEKNGNLADAERFYQSIVDELGDDVWKLPGNLYFRLGSVTFGLKDYKRSSTYLELAMRYPGYSDDPRIFEMLGTSYIQTERPEMASRAMLLRAAADPNVNLDPSKLVGLTDNRNFPPLPSVPEVDILRKRLLAPRPTDPPSATNLALSSLSINYAAALEAVNWINAAERYENAAYHLVFQKASENIDEGSSNEEGLRELARLSELPGYSDLPPKLIGAGVQLEMQAYVNLGKYYHAAKALERLSTLSSYDRKNIHETAVELQRSAFTNVSFDMNSGSVRSIDPREFIDTAHLVEIAERANGKKVSKISKESKKEKNRPYAELSQSEDWAEMNAAVVGAEIYPAVKKEIIHILEKCMDDHKFELPVKFSLHLLASSILDSRATSGITLRERLEREIYDSKPPPRETTLDAYQAGKTLSALLK